MLRDPPHVVRDKLLEQGEAVSLMAIDRTIKAALARRAA